MMECGHLGPQKNKHNMPHQLIPLTQVIPMQAFLNNCWEIMQLAPVTSKTGNLVLFIPKVLQAVVTTRIFLRHTADVQSDSGCPTPCDGCGILYCRTPHTQLGRVFRCFPFFDITQIFSDILWTSDSAQWPGCFFIIGQLAPNLAECSDVFLS